jgi:hypothetical protein
VNEDVGIDHEGFDAFYVFRRIGPVVRTDHRLIIVQLFADWPSAISENSFIREFPEML